MAEAEKVAPTGHCRRNVSRSTGEIPPKLFRRGYACDFKRSQIRPKIDFPMKTTDISILSNYTFRERAFTRAI